MPHFRIQHQIEYRYDAPVELHPHWIRLQPRGNHFQQLRAFQLQIHPQPDRLFEVQELDGNLCQRAWFDRPSDHVKLQAIAEVVTCLENPFEFLLEPWAIRLPLRAEAQSQGDRLGPYRHSHLPGSFDPACVRLAQQLLEQAKNDTVAFLLLLNQYLYERIRYVQRPFGEPRWPGQTLALSQGSCRDTTVVFLEICRAVGLAGRFVSGYHWGGPEAEQFDLHAWAEVYLPGAGWRGFDPTIGLATAETHIAIASAPLPSQAAPTEGSYYGPGISATLSYQVVLVRLSD
ncbi:transglutaminase family protein [Synechococcus elongatus]|uniref:transglutaminase family protein n=1 Tax=Synechococcus elongatus TaxID=32046 RepID=UPI0030CF8A5F